MPKAKFEFTGDFAELNEFADKCERLPGTLDLLSKQLSEEAIDLIHEGFDKEEDPYGEAWAPPLLRDGQALSDTGGLRSSWHRTFSSARGFSVASGKLYAVYHQSGTGIYGPRKRRIRPRRARALGPLPDGNFYRSVKGSPRRRMVPGRGALPAAWKRRFVAAAHEVLTEIFR